MTLRGDDRAVTVQVGTILLFAALIVSMSIYQSAAVPEQNERVEYEHGQRVQSDMLELRNAILRTGATGAGRPTAVELGTRYPVRMVFVNPPPATGTLRTVPLGDLVVSNAVALDAETGDYWTGASREFPTSALVYEPDYREYGGAPATIYENSLLYNRFDNGANITLADQRVVDGRRITLVTLDGPLSRSGTGPFSVDPRSLSPSATEYRTVSLRNASGGPVSITIPTRLSETAWRELLADELDGGGADPDAYVAGFEYREESGPNAVTLTFEAGESYELRLAKVGVGDGANAEGAHYVVDVEGDDRTIDEGEPVTLVAEVRDRYDNPVGGVALTAQVTAGNGSLVRTSATTDGSGRASFRYQSGAVSGDEDATVNVSFGAGDAERAHVVFDLHVENDGSGDGSTGGGDGTNAPVREQFDIADTSNTNHAKYGIGWSISDPDGDLSEVTVELVDSSGTVVDSSTTDFTRADYRSGNAYLQRKDGAGSTYTIRLTARDAAGHAVTWTKSDTANGQDPA